MNDFNTFLENEKDLNIKFLEHFQITEERFDIEEYEMLKKLWLKQDLIDEIYHVIDDILKTLGCDTNWRFIIIGDFLFSLISINFSNPNELIFRITRNEYFIKIRLRLLVFSLFNKNWDKYLIIHKKLLIGLCNKNIAIKKVFKIYENKTWKSVSLYKFSFSEIQFEDNIVLHKHCFIIINLVGVWCGVKNLRNIYKIKRKSREMRDVQISHNGLIKANQLKFKLSSKLLDLNKNIICFEKKKLLESVNCIDTREYFIELRKKCEDWKYALKMSYYEEINFKEKRILIDEMSNEYKDLTKIFQKIILFKIIENNIWDKIFYLPSFQDNRIRQYYSSILSPTFYIIIRYLYVFNDVKKMINLETSIFFKKIIKFKYLVEHFNLNFINSYLLIVLLIEVGKFFLKNKNQHMWKTEEIIDQGLKNYKIKTKIDFENMLYLNKIYWLIDELIEKKKIDINSIIFKDATASGLQNYGIILGYKENKLEYLNLNGDGWCDTYQYLINLYLKTPHNEFKKRIYWKGTIMTIPYNAEWFSCFTKFLEQIRKDGIEYLDFTEEKKNEIKLLHKNFYNDIKNKVKEEFFENKTGVLKKYTYDKWIIMSINEYKINYEKKRDKYRDIVYVLVDDLKTTETALEANNMQNLDGELVQYLLKKIEIITIHDCFGVRLSELHLLMDEINSYYSNIIGIKTYCTNIIL